MTILITADLPIGSLFPHFNFEVTLDANSFEKIFDNVKFTVLVTSILVCDETNFACK